MTELHHHGVKGMHWKQTKKKPDNFKWRNTSGRTLVRTNNRQQLLKRLIAMKKKAGFKTRDVSKLSNSMIRLILNSDQLQTKLSQAKKKHLNNGKKIFDKLPKTLFQTKV